MKCDWKKEEKALYLPGRKPALVEVAPQRHIVIEGMGNPNTEPYAERVAVLYALAWSIRMMPKSGFTPEGYYEYSVYPLEGLYALQGDWFPGTSLDKEALTYTLMIRQPDFVTPAVFAAAMATVERKKAPPHLALARLETVEDGLSVQMMHIGAYDDEPASFAAMDAFCQAEGLERRDVLHREIYLGDPRRTRPENLRTVLRYGVTRR